MHEKIKSNFKRNNLSFLKGFLHHPSLVGSVIPSSRFLEQRLVKVGAVSEARVVVELGPGTGGTTQAMLNALPKEASLLAIELNKEFVSQLEQLNDRRLIVHNGSAEQICETLSLYGLPKPDVVVSGIPFSTMPSELGKKIISQIWSCLAPGGRFVAYQVRDKVALLGKEIIGAPVTSIELLNVPPVRVYSWRKH